ncbi:MAG: hypothetical protein JJ992_24505, partial [Planctomycetes bacterium]|nr:hypothetical protein [Planctomycetota bacterium]
VTRRLLSKNPEDRFDSADEPAKELGHCLTLLNEAPTDEMSGIMRRARLSPGVSRPSAAKSESGRTRRAVFKVLAAVIALSLIVAAIAVWLRRHERLPEVSQTLIVVGDPRKDPSYVATISEALRRAGPGTIIRVYPGEYTETIVIDQADRLAGITIEGVLLDGQRPVLLGAESGTKDTLLTVRDVSHVTLRGFEIEPHGNYGIVIKGACSDILIEQLNCVQPLSGGEPPVDINASATVGDGGPIILRNSTFECPGPGHCLRLSNRNCLQTTVVENNLFVGRGVLVLADLKLIEVTIRGNVFATPRTAKAGETKVPPPTVGLNLDVSEPSFVKRILVNNNTFLDVTHWLGLVSSAIGTKTNVEIRNNLILNSQSIQGELFQIDHIADYWVFAGNWWELSAESGGIPETSCERFAEIKPRIDVLNRSDPASDDFLRPPPDSPLRDVVAGASDVFDYVGAKRPSDQQPSVDPSQDSPLEPTPRSE